MEQVEVIDERIRNMGWLRRDRALDVFGHGISVYSIV
jgi:hypothetical protein